MAHTDTQIDGSLAFNIARLAKITGNPMLDVKYQAADARPYFKFGSMYYTTLHPKNARSATSVSVYTRGTRVVDGVEYATMTYVGTGSQNGATLTYAGGKHLNSKNEHEDIRIFVLNKWAKYKPFRNSSPRFISQEACDNARAVEFQGFNPSSLVSEMTPGSDGTFPHLIYSYLPPRIGENEFGRMFDFTCQGVARQGYYKNAVPPIAFKWTPDDFRRDWVFFLVFQANPTGEANYDMYNCLSVDDLYNNAVANGMYSYCPSVIVQDLTTKEFIVVSSGVTLSSINKTNGTAIITFRPDDMPFFTDVYRVGHQFEMIACLAQLDKTNGTALQGTDYGPVYVGQEHVLYGARSLEFEEGFNRKTVTLIDVPPKDYDGVSLGVSTFTAVRKSGTSIMGASWTDFYINSNLTITWATDSNYDNTEFPVRICFLSSNSSGIPLINGAPHQGGLYKTQTVLVSGINGMITISSSELLNVILSAPTTIGNLGFIVKAEILNPNSDQGQYTISAQRQINVSLG